METLSRQQPESEQGYILAKLLAAFVASLTPEKLKGLAWATCGNVFFVRSQNLPEALELFEKAYGVFAGLAEKSLIGTTLHNAGTAYLRLACQGQQPEENFLEAVACYHAALALRSAQDAPSEYARTMLTLGQAYQTMCLDFELADQVPYFQEGLTCYEEASRVLQAAHLPEYSTAAAQVAAAKRQLEQLRAMLPVDTPPQSLSLAPRKPQIVQRFQQTVRTPPPPRPKSTISVPIIQEQQGGGGYWQLIYEDQRLACGYMMEQPLEHYERQILRQLKRQSLGTREDYSRKWPDLEGKPTLTITIEVPPAIINGLRKFARDYK